MPTNNKGLNQPVLGTTGWGTPINENASILDLALGAFEVIAGTSGDFALSATEVQSMCLKSDTGAFVSDVTYIVPSGVAGQWLVKNQSAPSSSSLIVKNAASAESVSIPSGQSRLVYSDGTGVTFSDYQAPVATQAEAEAGTNNASTMTPLRTAQAVQFSRASQAQAEAGTDNTTLMTPLRTAQAVGVPSSAPLKSGLNATGAAPIYAARGWVDFDWTGSVVILVSKNVSSVVRIGTGAYTVSHITPMPTETYVISGLGNQGGGLNSYGVAIGITAISSTSFSMQARRVTDHTTFESSGRLVFFA